MIDAILGVFTLIGNIIKLIVSVVEMIIKSFLALFDMLANLDVYIELMTGAVSILPPYCSLAFTAAISATIVWIIIKRGPAE